MPETKPVRVDKPWGHELIWAHTDRYVGKILHIKAGHALSLQYHLRKDETVHVLAGRMRFQTGGEGEPLNDRVLGPGESFHITPLLRHRMIAETDCDILEASTPELDDVVRLEDRYGRVQK
jgi:mannose-6-phosphate isomerase-like protein (cupin superfamily)